MPVLKICFKCHRELPLADFYVHPRMSDGHLGKCKECTRADVKRNRDVMAGAYRAYDRQRNRSPKRLAKKRFYQRATRRRDPVRAAAWRKVDRALHNGTLVRKPCEICRNPRSEAHHEDYSRPMDVRWLCFFHHRKVGHGHYAELPATRGGL